MDIILPNFVCTLILTRSRLGLLPGIFRTLVTEFLPLIDVRSLFLLNHENKWIDFYQIVYMH